MTIHFFTQNNATKNPAPIYVRLRDGAKVDAKAKTKYSIDPTRLKKGKVLLLNSKGNADALEKKRISSINKGLETLDKELSVLKQEILRAYNNKPDYDTIDSTWLKNVVSPNRDNIVPTNLVEYFDYFIAHKKDIKPGTVKQLKTFKARLSKFEKEWGRIAIPKVNKGFSSAFQKWSDKMNYAHNTKVKTLKVVLTVCNHAHSFGGIPVSNELPVIVSGFNLTYKRVKHIHLTFDELKVLEGLKIADKDLDTARDWLIISCYTAQRVSDFMRFDASSIFKSGKTKLLDISQEKTNKQVYIPLNDEVLKILDKRGGDFPPLYSKSVESNKTIYNRYIKKVCKLAGFNELVIAQKRNPKTNRYETFEMPKYKAVSSHIGRRSFATNYYGKIDTSLLISATKHATERAFLTYVNKPALDTALDLASAISNLSKDNSKDNLKIA